VKTSSICRQYRHGPRRVGLTFPGGRLETGESPLEAARRELFEETGFESDTWTYFGGFMVNANQGGAVSHMFHATGCRRTAALRSDDLEATEILLLSRDELLAAVGQGEIVGSLLEASGLRLKRVSRQERGAGVRVLH